MGAKPTQAKPGERDPPFATGRSVVEVRAMNLSKLVFALPLFALVACGEPPPAASPQTPEPVAPTPTPVASVAPPASAEPAKPAPLTGSFASFVRAANSGKVDKIGEKDGVFKADGVKDLVFEAEFEGPAAAFFIASVDDSGQPNGDFDADTLTGDEGFPPELSRALNAGGYTAGVGIYEGDKLLNEADGGIAPLAAGAHKLTFHISAKTAPKGPVRIYAMLTDKTVITGPVVAAPTKAAAKGASAKKP